MGGVGLMVMGEKVRRHKPGNRESSNGKGSQEANTRAGWREMRTFAIVYSRNQIENMFNPDANIMEQPLWLVWYEDRFQMGEDRDPAVVVTCFTTKKEAEDYIHSHEGLIDISSGKFDGLFYQEWTVSEAIRAGLVPERRIIELFNGSKS